MMGRNILQARLGRYENEGAYRHAFAAEIAARRLDVARAAGA